MTLSGVRLSAGLLITFMAAVVPRTAVAAPQSAAIAAAAAPPVVVDGVTINGPAPPVAPAVESRDSEGRVTVRAVRVAQAPRIDGQLDENIYRTTPPIGGFIQMDPDHGAPATEPTEVWLFFDNDNLYVGVKCYDSAPEEKWVANEMRRDSRTISRQNEAFHISLDTFYDRRNAFLFTITPIGGIFDGQVTNEQIGANADWNPVWDRDVGRFEGGWSAEMAIPFKSLRYTPGRTQVWGINFLRLVRWKNEQTFLVPLPRNSSNAIFQVSLYGTLVGLEAPPGSKNLEIKPYAISRVTTDPVANPVSPDDVDGDVGVDVKYGLTQNLTADFTYNTDFAQVEVDEQQVNLTRFNLFFPEKREFFLESAGLFEFGGTGSGNVPALFYSRQIGISQGRPVPLQAGGRLTGKVGKFSVGLLNVEAERESVSATPATNFSVVRLRRDILRRSNVGALFTRRSQSALGNGSNEVYGVDGALGFYNYLNINAYLARSQTPGLSDDDMSYRTQLNYAGDRYGVQLERLLVGQNFNPEVGFLRRSDFAQNFGQLRFSPRPRRSRVRRYNSQVSYSYITDGRGRLDTRSSGAAFGVDFQNGDGYDVNYDRTYEFLERPFRIARGVTIPIGGYDYQNVATSYFFGIQRKISGSVSFERGSFYSGDRTAVAYRSGRVELSPQFSLEPGMSINHVVLPEGRFTTKLISNRATYTVTPRMFFSGLAQYNSSTHTVSANLRLRWEYQPGSELFVVYTDERDTNAPGYPRVENRAFAVKINRLVRF